ncbi:dnaK protein [Tritrichomonas foetus]|uniref:DnaK protein n=1 Tax=Tritrichomonas foetus TaxID=1144522 RepID=A0A1J4J7D9_9EUKA|nr:dnaK protein [Tritrichomonas foetus]|eukprot:OHS93116.1 dnaK protein [Tritrichomonas foetus]
MFLLYFLPFIASSSIFAFDFGTQNVRIAHGVPGKPIEILTNDQGSRATPNYLAYKLENPNQNLAAAEWFVGVDAERIYFRNSSHGIKNPFYYLSDPSKTTLNDVPPATAAAVAFSLHLRKFKRKHDKLIVAVPSVFSPHARHSIIQSLKMLDISSAQILDSNSAIAALYAVERLKKAADNENLTQKIIFFDIGAIQTEISLWQFTRYGPVTQIELLDYRYSDEIGGDIIDELLLSSILSKLPREPTRAEMTNVIRAMKKGKERLASGSEQFIDLTEDFNQRLWINNSDIESLSKDVLEKLNRLIQGMEMPDEIELVGGCSRLPSIVNVIQNNFPNYTLRRSLNSDEAVALGAAYYSSLQTGTIVGSRLEFIKPQIYGLDFQVADKNYDLYKTGDRNDRKSVTMKKFRDFNFSVKVTKKNDHPKLHITSKLFNDVPENFTEMAITGLTNITRSITKQLANGSRPFIRFTFGHSQVLDCLDYISSALTANISVNVTIEGEVAHVDSTTSSWGLTTTTTMTADEFKFNETENSDFMGAFLDATAERKAHAANTHKIEAFIIDLTDKIEYDTDFQTVTSEEERSTILEIISREREAIEMSGSRVSAADLGKRFDKLKEKLKDTLFRFQEFKQRPAAIAKLNQSIARAEKALVNATTDNETIEDFISFLNETKTLVFDAERQQPLEKPKITAKQLKERESRLLRRIPDLKSTSRRRSVKKPKNEPPVNSTVNVTSSDGNSTVENTTNADSNIEVKASSNVQIESSTDSQDSKHESKTLSTRADSDSNTEDNYQSIINQKIIEPNDRETTKRTPPPPDAGGIFLLKTDDDKEKEKQKEL